LETKQNDKRIASTSSLSQFCREGCEMLCWPALSCSSMVGVATVTFAADIDNYDAK
jgi:hypothetical protein